MVKWDNPSGHWESRSLMELNDELLARLQGFWWAPPELPDGWESSTELKAVRQQAAEGFYAVHPAQDWVWKDPRVCLTLPFWISALDVDPVCVLTLRHPSEVADSLVARDGFGLHHALAIWEWYTISVLRHLRGRSVAVVRYRDLMEDPVRTVTWLRDDLADLGVAVADDGVDGAAAFVDQRLYHHRADRARIEPASQKGLRQLLTDLDSCYDSFPELEIPPLTATTVELVTMHRRFQQLQVEHEERTQWALSLEREVRERNEAIRDQQQRYKTLNSDLDKRTQWGLKLEKELGERDQTVLELRSMVERLEAEPAKKEAGE